VSLRRLEPGLAALFRDRAPGTWVPVRDLYERAGTSTEPIPTSLAAAWLPSPGDPDYAVIVFFDDETKWSFTADCNATRLLGRRAESPAA
jgi:hypothetical protein